MVSAFLKVKNDSGSMMKTVSRYFVKNDSAFVEEGFIRKEGLKFRFEKISTQARTIVLGIYQKNPDYVVVKVVIFPNIGVVWTGAILIIAGFFVALWRRVKNKVIV
jgi:cytochrome c-type biogenesis protein CcmF